MSVSLVRCPACNSTDVDWHKYHLRQLPDLAQRLEPKVAEWLTHEVHDWWMLAAVNSGWTPKELTRIR